MRRSNLFIEQARCPHCGDESLVAFQADIGVLEWQTFQVGDRVFGILRNAKKPPAGPAPGLEGRDFWAHGVGDCPSCGRDLWCRIEVRSNRFASLDVVPEPAEPDGWGTLEGTA